MELRKYLGEVFKRLAKQKEYHIEEGHLLPDLVSTVGRDDWLIRDYIFNQDEEDRRLDQMQIWQ